MSLAKLVVTIEKNDKGEIKSGHRFLTPEDKKTLESWPSRGLAQMSHALFVEALRRESYTMMIAAMSKGVSSHDLDREEVAGMVVEHLNKLLHTFVNSAVDEAFEVLQENQ